MKKEQKPYRSCGDCLHYTACSSWNVGSLLTTNAANCINWQSAADVRPVVLCRDCKHNNACLTQAFVEDASRVPFDRNTFFCADGKRADDA